MKKLYKSVISIVSIVVLSLYIGAAQYRCYASELDPGEYTPKGEIDSSFVKLYGGKISTVLFVIGILVAIISIMYIGLKYITSGSVTQKVDYKKDIMPVAFGAIFLTLLATILGIIAKLAEQLVGGA